MTAQKYPSLVFTLSILTASISHSGITEDKVNWTNVAKQANNPPEWWLATIEKELAPFKAKNFSSSKIDKLKHSFPRGELARFTAVHGDLRTLVIPNHQPQKFQHIFWKPLRLDVIERVIKMLIKRNMAPANFDCVAMVADWSYPGYAEIPVLVPAQFSTKTGTILVPDAQTFDFLCDQQEAVIQSSSNPDLSWETKKNIAFWRGAAHDANIAKTLEEALKTHRARLVTISRNNKNLIDAEYSALYDSLSSHRFLKRHFGITSPATVEEQARYKYLPSIDGSTAAFSGFVWRLLSGSVTIKQDSDEIQWFYRQLKPYEHYVPVQRDVSNLPDIVNWLRTHDDDAQRIAHNAMVFAQQYLTLESQLAYFAVVLQKYADLQEKNAGL